MSAPALIKVDKAAWYRFVANSPRSASRLSVWRSLLSRSTAASWGT